MKKLRVKKGWVEDYEKASTQLEDLKVLLEFYEAEEVEEEEIDQHYSKSMTFLEELEFKNMLSAEEDSLNAIMQITAGAGGTESCDLGFNADEDVHHVGREKRI